MEVPGILDALEKNTDTKLVIDVDGAEDVHDIRQRHRGRGGVLNRPIKVGREPANDPVADLCVCFRDRERHRPGVVRSQLLELCIGRRGFGAG